MKVILATGGTGGHLFPAQALAEQLLEADEKLELLFVGGGLSTNPYFDRSRFAFVEVSCGKIALKSPLALLKQSFHLLRGVGQSHKILREFAPDVVVGFGSYHAFPILLAARMHGIPIVLHEANAIPGKVNRFFSKSARVTGVHFPAAEDLFKGKTALSPIPLRASYLSKMSKEAARQALELDPTKLTFLVFGGSQGAVALNSLASEAFAMLQEVLPPFQLLHMTGHASSTAFLTQFYVERGISAIVKDFEKEMHLGLYAADLIISRAGACSIAEQMQIGVPGILIPYPYAAEQHQDRNADSFVLEVKGGIKLIEKKTSAKQLAEAIEGLVSEDGKRLKQLAESIKTYQSSRPSVELIKLVIEV